MSKGILSLEFEHGNWSWSQNCQALLARLQDEFKTKSMDIKSYHGQRKGDIVLLQNIKHLDKVADQKTICRLGGNKSFEGKDVTRTAHYLKKMSQCFAIIATNENLFKIGKSVHERTYLIPNGLDLDVWKLDRRRKLNPGILTVGFAGNVITEQKKQYKGYKIIKRACRELKYPFEEALYGNKRIPYEKMIERFYSKIDVFVLLTDGEGCSNAIMEALACGIPVITTMSAGYHGEKLVHGKNALFCKKNLADVKSQLKELANRPGLHRQLSYGARLFAEQNHDINNIAEKYREIFQLCEQEIKKEIIVIEEREKAIEAREKAIADVEEKEEEKIERQVSIIPNKSLSITVFCVLCNGPKNFDESWVIKLYNMVKRHTTFPFEFVCLTDRKEINGINTVPLQKQLAGWWSKIELFRRGISNAERIIYFDLDTVILDNIDDLFFIKSEFAALRPWRAGNRAKGVCASGLMTWENGKWHDVFYDFDMREVTEKGIRNDQHYISTVLAKRNFEYTPLQSVVPGIYSYKRDCKHNLPTDARIVCFHGKPGVDKVTHSWVQENWK